MGSKNRILLGHITSRITHYFRNTFENDIYITKVTAEKIKIKHSPLDKEFIYNNNFQIIVDNTIYINYDVEDNSWECLSKIEDKYYFYVLIVNNRSTHVKSLYIPKLKKIEVKFFKNEKAKKIL